MISESFQKAAAKSKEILQKISIPVELTDRQSLLQSASTSLNSKVVSQHSSLLSPIAVDAVLKVIDPKVATNVDLRDIKLIKKLGGTVDDTELIEGLVLDQKTSGYDGPKKIEKAKIGLIQFCISPPKTDVKKCFILLKKILFNFKFIFLKYKLDGEQCNHQRLHTNGSNLERRASVYFEHCKKNQSSQLQCSLDPEEHFA